MKISNRNKNGITIQSDWSSSNFLFKDDSKTLRLLLCQSVNANLLLNSESYELRKSDVLICYPGDIMSITTSHQCFLGSYLSIQIDLLEQIFLLSSKSWKASAFGEKIHLFSFEDDTIQLLLSYLRLLEARLHHSAFTNDLTSLYDLLSLFIRDFLSIIKEKQYEQESTNFSAANVLFNKFIRLLYSAPPQKQCLEYYANKLFVTPKYLSSTCKQVAGETASTLINRFLMNEIRHQLKIQSKPIQSIAYELGFANQSFFGKFVKAHLGMTASQFRESRCY